MTQRRIPLRLIALMILSSALLLAACGQGVDDSASLLEDAAVERIQNEPIDSGDSQAPEDSNDSSAPDAPSSSDSPEVDAPNVLTDGELDLNKVEAELEAIEKELDSLVFPDDSMFDDAESSLF